MSRRSRILLVGLPLAVVVAAGVVGGLVWLKGTVNTGLFTSPDGTQFAATFPGGASRESVTVGASNVTAWVHRDGIIQYAAWTVKFTDVELNRRPEHTLSLYLNNAVNLSGPGISSTGGDFDGLPAETIEVPLYDPSGFPKSPTGWCAARVVLCGDTGYVMRVFGGQSTPDAPHVVAFFNSLRIPGRVQLPPPAPDDEDLKVVAEIDPTSAAAFTSDAAFTVAIPGLSDESQLRERKSAFPLGVPPPGVLRRYTAPAFAPNGAWSVAAAGYRMVADEPRRRLILAAHVEGDPDDTAGTARPFADLHVYDQAALPPPGKAIKPIKVAHLSGHVLQMSLTPDGKHLLVVEVIPAAHRDSWVKDEAQSKTLGRVVWVKGPRLDRDATARLVRFDADTLEQTGQMPLHAGTEAVVRVPGTATYYAAATVSGHLGAGQGQEPKGEFRLIDMAAFKTTRTFRANVDPWGVAATADGKLLVAGGSASDQTLTVIDPEVTVTDSLQQTSPKMRRVRGIETGYRLMLSPNGQRLYAWRDGADGIRCWDAERLVGEQRRFEVGDTSWKAGGARADGKPIRQPDEVRGLVAIRADGKFAATASGHLLRLTGGAP